MNGTLITSTPKSSMHALACQGIMVASCYPQLRDMLRKKLGDDYVLLFAEPMPNSADNSIDWYTPVQGAVQRLDALPEAAQNRLRDTLAQMAAEIRRYADELRQSPDSAKQTRGEILRLALHYPGEERIFVVGDQPVFTCWGHGPGTPGAEAQDLSRLSRNIQKAPLMAVAAAEREEPLPAEGHAPPLPRTEQEPEPRGRLAPFPGAGCLWWLLALLLLLVLLFLLCVGIDEQPARSGLTLYRLKSRMPPELGMLRDRNRALEDEISGLKERLQKHVAGCREETPAEPAGEAMRIPEKSAGISFLQGAWRCETGLVNLGNNEPLVIEFRFDEKGEGQAIVQEQNGNRCTGPVRATLGDAGLHIAVDPQRCTDGSLFSSQKIDCKNEGQSAQCSGLNEEQGNHWEARFFRLGD